MVHARTVPDEISTLCWRPSRPRPGRSTFKETLRILPKIPHYVRDARIFTSRVLQGFFDDVDDHDAGLLSGLDITIGVGDFIERISAIEDRDEFSRFDLVPQCDNERLSAPPLRQWNDNSSATGDL